MAEFDNISKLQNYEDYIANNITEWEAESIARVCRKIGKIGRMSKKDLEKFDADKEAKKEWERIVTALAIATALNIRTLKKAYISEFEAWEKQNEYLIGGIMNDSNCNVSQGMITLRFPLKAQSGVVYTESAVRKAMSRVKGAPFLGVDNKPIGFVGDVSGVRYTVGDSYITCEIPVTIFNVGICMSHEITEREDDNVRIVDFELDSVYIDI